MKKKAIYFLSAAVAAAAGHGSGLAGETTTYTYDPLGRLVAVSTSGGPNNGLAVGIQYDPAGNRCNYHVSGSSGPPAPPASGCGAAPPGNQPPTTVADSLSMPRCTSGSANVTANDTDPEGHYPLALLSVSPGTKGTAYLIDGSTIGYDSSGPTGTDVLTYTLRDSLGASSTGTLTVTIAGGVCP